MHAHGSQSFTGSAYRKKLLVITIGLLLAKLILDCILCAFFCYINLCFFSLFSRHGMVCQIFGQDSVPWRSQVRRFCPWRQLLSPVETIHFATIVCGPRATLFWHSQQEAPAFLSGQIILRPPKTMRFKTKKARVLFVKESPFARRG